MIIDALVAGLTLGGMYALIAMGLTLQYGVSRIMNLAHGEVLIAAAFAAYLLVSQWGLNPLLGMLLIVPGGFVLSWLIYQVLLTPLVARNRGKAALEIDSILATFGLLFIIQGVMLAVFGGNYTSYNFLNSPVAVLGTVVAANRLVVLACAAVFGIGFYLLMNRTRLGTALRAVAVDPVAAGLVAIDTQRAAALAFALGGGMAALGGVLVSMFLTFSANMGVAFTMKALVVIIMGGVGNVLGALLAGLILGVAESLVATYVDPGLTIAMTYAVFMAVLLVRPAGLFGKVAR